MGSLPFPSDEPEAWDTLLLGGRNWPGIAHVKVKGGRKIDRKQGPGQHGEKITVQGKKAKDVDITIRCWTRDQCSDLEDAIATVDPQRDEKKDPEPLFIAHPVTAMRGVANVTIEDIEGPDWDKGFMIVTLKAIEFSPPPKKSATSSPSGGKAGSGWYAVDNHGQPIAPPGPEGSKWQEAAPSKKNVKP